MKKLLLPLLTILILTGCAQNYTMKLTNGRQITSTSKPKLKDGVYYFKDARGQENKISQSRVTEIIPSSMAEKEKARFNPSSR